MKRLLIIAGIVLAVGVVAHAAPKPYPMSLPVGTNTAAVSTFGGDAGLWGHVAEITISSGDGASGATVSVAYAAMDTNVQRVVIASNAVAPRKIFRPRLDSTDAAGADLTSDPPGRVLLTGERIVVGVMNSPTGVVWNVTIKVDD